MLFVIFILNVKFNFRIVSHALAELEAENKQVTGVVLESPFNNLSDEIKEYPICQVSTG